MTAEIYSVPDALLAEVGLQPLGATAPCYRCDDVGAVLVPIAELRGPVIHPGRRGLVVDRLRSVLQAIVSGSPLPAVPVYREPGAAHATVLDGAHGYAISLALGFASIPCLLVSRDDAELVYQYPEGQR